MTNRGRQWRWFRGLSHRQFKITGGRTLRGFFRWFGCYGWIRCYSRDFRWCRSRNTSWVNCFTIYKKHARDKNRLVQRLHFIWSQSDMYTKGNLAKEIVDYLLDGSVTCLLLLSCAQIGGICTKIPYEIKN